MENKVICPNCGRHLTPDEMYCYFCEMDVSELRNKNKQQSDKKSK